MYIFHITSASLMVTTTMVMKIMICFHLVKHLQKRDFYQVSKHSKECNECK